MRWFVVLLAGCGFTARSPVSGDARLDSGASDAAADARGDGGGSAMPDAAADAARTAQITYIQGTTTAGMASVAVLTLPMAVADGDLCVVSVGINGNSIASVTDGGGDMFSPVGTNGSQTVYIAANMRASATATVTISFTGVTGYTAAAAQYRGLAPTSPLDSTSSTAGNGNTLDSGATTTTHPHDLLVGLAVSNGNLGTGTGYTMRVGPTYSLIEDKEVTSTGTYHATATANSNPTWAIRVLALKAAD